MTGRDHTDLQKELKSSQNGKAIITQMLENLGKRESISIMGKLFPNTNLEGLSQISSQFWPAAEFSPLNPGGLPSRKEWDYLGSCYKNFQEGFRPEMKQFPTSVVWLPLLSTWRSPRKMLFPGPITLTLGSPKPQLGGEDNQLSVILSITKQNL